MVQNWHALSVNKTLAELKTKPDGLSRVEVSKRQQQYGANRLAHEKKLSGLTILLSQFNNALIYILLIACVISFVLSDPIDANIILAAVVINVVVGFIQEQKANRALAELNKIAQLKARVIRQGKEISVAIEELVPGDIVSVLSGDKVPADIRLIEIKHFQVNEAPLTGESAMVTKQTNTLSAGLTLPERNNMIYMSTLAVEGSARGVVVATGSQTEIGRVASLLKETEDDSTPIQKKLDSLSKNLAILVLAVALLIFFLGLLRGREVLEMFNTAVALAVAAIPEALVIGVTVVLTIGMKRILKEKGLVRKLVAAETLGSTTVICTDKTGTLTQGQMRVAIAYIGKKEFDGNSLVASIGNQELEKLLSIGVLCNDSVIEDIRTPLEDWVIAGNSTDKALLIAGGQFRLLKDKLEKDFPRLDAVPFSSDRKYMVTLHKAGQDNILYYKGAPEMILAFADSLELAGKVKPLTPDLRKNLIAKQLELSRQGLRVLALGYKSADQHSLIEKDKLEQEVVFYGFVGISDVLRPEAAEVLAQAKKSGIHTVIITGDNKVTARVIATQLGMKIKSDNIMEGSELAKYSDRQLVKKVKDILVYARVTPQDKLRIVRAWQQRGEVVAMTGDGINDAPALKAADIGVALNSGTDVAKETADLVLLDNNFKTIVAAVREGRVIFDNVRKVVLYLLADSFGAVFCILIYFVYSFSYGGPLPLVAAQILWLNLVTDSLPDMALTFEPAEKGVLDSKPAKRQQPILDFERKFLVAIISLLSGLGAFVIHLIVLRETGNVAMAQTATFAALGTVTVTYVYSLRNIKKSFFRYNIFSNNFLNLAVMFSFLLQLVGIYWPVLQKILGTAALNSRAWALIIAFAVLMIVIIEIVKMVFIIKRSAGRIVV